MESHYVMDDMRTTRIKTYRDEYVQKVLITSRKNTNIGWAISEGASYPQLCTRKSSSAEWEIDTSSNAGI